MTPGAPAGLGLVLGSNFPEGAVTGQILPRPAEPLLRLADDVHVDGFAAASPDLLRLPDELPLHRPHSVSHILWCCPVLPVSFAIFDRLASCTAQRASLRNRGSWAACPRVQHSPGKLSPRNVYISWLLKTLPFGKARIQPSTASRSSVFLSIS